MKNIHLWALWLYASFAYAQAPAAPEYEDCLKQKPALQTLESALQDGEQILTLTDISHRAMIFIEACGSGGGGGNPGNGAGGSGGGSAILVHLQLRCGERLGAWAGTSGGQKLDCTSPVSVKVPGRAAAGQSGNGAMLQVPGVGDVPISVGGGAGASPQRGAGGNVISGAGVGYRTGGQGFVPGTSDSDGTVRDPAVSASEGEAGGPPKGGISGGRLGGGGGGASEIGEGGNGGAWGQSGSAGGYCAGGGGAGWRKSAEATTAGGPGGPGYARIVALDINEVANCGRAALLKNLRVEVSRLVQEELKKPAIPPPATPTPATVPAPAAPGPK